MGYVIITSLGFVFDGLGLDIVGTGVSNASILVL